MSAIPATDRIFSVEEYLTLERAAFYKSEWIDGAILVRPGRNVDQCLIASNLILELKNALDDGPCEVFGSDLRVGIRTSPATEPFHLPVERERGIFGYPDLSVVRGRLELYDRNEDVLMNPALLIEIVSPSSDHHVRDLKLPRYQAMPSLRGILLVHSHRAEVEHFSNHADRLYLGNDGEWIRTTITGLDESVVLSSFIDQDHPEAVMVPLARIYRHILAIVGP